jgi:hypothetical protein
VQTIAKENTSARSLRVFLAVELRFSAHFSNRFGARLNLDQRRATLCLFVSRRQPSPGGCFCLFVPRILQQQQQPPHQEETHKKAGSTTLQKPQLMLSFMSINPPF